MSITSNFVSQKITFPFPQGTETSESNTLSFQSLEELRQEISLEDLMKALSDGSLTNWLNDFFYELEATSVSELPTEDTPTNRRKLCNILNLNFYELQELTPEEQSIYDAKKAIMEQYTSEPDILCHVLDTATNQGELAKLLKENISPIYLCHGTFSIPIQKCGVHYIGIGTPMINAGFSQEQYEKAGITFENLQLPPAKEDEQLKAIARSAAQSNGYDDFAENHTAFAQLVHQKLKAYKYTQSFRLKAMDQCGNIAGKFYKNKTECISDYTGVINSAWNEANTFFNPSKMDDNIAGDTAQVYTNWLQSALEDILSSIQSTEETSKLIDLLRHIQKTAKDYFSKELKEELADNREYYQMYDKNYFINQVDIDIHDYNLDTGDKFIDFFSKVVNNATEYTISGLFEVIGEIESDANKNADSFYSYAYSLYEAYCREIEEVAEKIGKIQEKQADSISG